MSNRRIRLKDGESVRFDTFEGLTWHNWVPETEEEKAWHHAEKAKWALKEKARQKTARFCRRADIKPRPCVCGAEKAHKHHVNYEYWYLVAFLCPLCHVREHKGKLNKPFEVHDLRELAVFDLVAFP